MRSGRDSNGERWTFETLKDYLLAIIESNDERYETKFSAQKDTVHMALSSADTAVRKAEVATEKRFDGVNEFRSAMADQQRTFMPRIESDMSFKAMDNRIMMLERVLADRSSKEVGSHVGYGTAIAVVSLLLSLLSIGAIVISVWKS